MSLTIQQIFDKAGKEKIALVQDEHIFYVVLNTRFNLLEPEMMIKWLGYIKQIEEYSDEAVMVTIGSGPKVFCAGFDLGFWKKAKENQDNTIKMLHVLNAKILTANIHTLCVLNGHAIGGGLLVAINHDKLIMNSNPAFKINLPEVQLKVAIPHGLVQNVRHCTSGSTARVLVTGKKVEPKEACELGVVSNLYENHDDLTKYVQAWADEFKMSGN